MRSVLSASLFVLLVSTATTSVGQETMTVGQLLAAGDRESSALGAAMYIMGWKEGASFQLTGEARNQQAAGAPQPGATAAQLEALGACLSTLEVADLAAGLHASLRDGTITLATAASSGLRAAMQGLCPANPGVNE